ncbi:MAG: FKBP-type peptidyl-prolyl cis-trans isomerase [Candidatus Paceibacterota bacterium]
MKKLSFNQWIAVAFGLVVVFWFFSSSSLMSSLIGGKVANSINTNEINMQNSNQVMDGLVVQDILVGDGAFALNGKMVTTHYTGMLQDGKIFDTSIGREPFSFPLGQGMVIQGWEKGIEGMKVGGKRRLIISPQLGYGSADMKDRAGNIIIPANSTLIFDVELLDVK